MKVQIYKIAAVGLILIGDAGCKNETPGNSTVKDDTTASASLVSATIADYCFKTPGTELSGSDSCTAVLRIGALDTKFVFYSKSPADVNAISYPGECNPVDFPNTALPAKCTIRFSGPLIRQTFGEEVVSLDCSAKGCVPHYRDPRPVQNSDSNADPGCYNFSGMYEASTKEGVVSCVSNDGSPSRSLGEAITITQTGCDMFKFKGENMDGPLFNYSDKIGDGKSQVEKSQGGKTHEFEFATEVMRPIYTGGKNSITSILIRRLRALEVNVWSFSFHVVDTFSVGSSNDSLTWQRIEYGDDGVKRLDIECHFVNVSKT